MHMNGGLALIISCPMQTIDKECLLSDNIDPIDRVNHNTIDDVTIDLSRNIEGRVLSIVGKVIRHKRYVGYLSLLTWRGDWGDR